MDFVARCCFHNLIKIAGKTNFFNAVINCAWRNNNYRVSQVLYGSKRIASEEQSLQATGTFGAHNNSKRIYFFA